MQLTEEEREKYTELNDCIEEFYDQIRTLEKQKLNKYKLFYHREGNQARYELALSKIENLDHDLRSSLYRMAMHILQTADIRKLHHIAL